MKLLNSLLDGKVTEYLVAPQVDERGSLVPVDLSELSFPIKRVLLIKASSNIERGGHGHYQGRQFLMHVSGRVEVEMRYNGKIEIKQLSHIGESLLIEPGVWATQKYSDENSALMVCCDTAYDKSDYYYEIERT
jgi:hypothetical protein